MSFALLSTLWSCPEDLRKSTVVVLRACQVLLEEQQLLEQARALAVRPNAQVVAGKGKGEMKLGTTWSTQRDLSGHKPNSQVFCIFYFPLCQLCVLWISGLGLQLLFCLLATACDYHHRAGLHGLRRGKSDATSRDRPQTGPLD